MENTDIIRNLGALTLSNSFKIRVYPETMEAKNVIVGFVDKLTDVFEKTALQIGYHIGQIHPHESCLIRRVIYLSSALLQMESSASQSCKSPLYDKLM